MGYSLLRSRLAISALICFEKPVNLGWKAWIQNAGLYRPGRSPSWIKVKNRQHPAMDRVREAFS
jgi:hypothetical protein